MRDLVYRSAFILHVAGAVMVAIISAVICVDVFARTVFDRPFIGVPDIAAVLMLLMTFSQLPWVILHGRLLRVEFVLAAIPGRLRPAADAIGFGAGLVVMGLLAWTGLAPMEHSLTSGEYYGNPVFSIPAWPVRITVEILWAYACLVCLYIVVESLRGNDPIEKDTNPEGAE